ncbi:MAG TPA: thiamine pyrophosphate-requiring protein [Pseudomonadales bacterium]|nr:thiamine pyrophosphate-requiring protein [Pseudomonadales bacterium]
MSAASPFASVAEHYLATLRARGIERLFVNAGTDFAPLVEAYGRHHDSNTAPFPAPIIATHENLAIGMAHGAYLVSGQPQALMLHTSVGTANAICGLLNAARDRIPIVLTAGRSPLFEAGALGARDMRIHWGQEMFDQAGMVRELVKWDYELRDARQVGDVVDRALTLAQAEPAGPVYLTLPREVLALPAAAGARAASAPLPIPSAPQPDRPAVARLAQRIAHAALPVIVAATSGADPAAVAALVALCDRFGIGYAEEQARYVNFPAGHPLHLGYDLGAVFADADVVCFVECDVPWLQAATAPRADAFVAHVGVDPAFARIPLRTHRSDLTITSTAAAFFDALATALEAFDRRDVDGRRQRVAAAAARRRPAPISPTAGLGRDVVAAAVAEAVGADALIFNEYWAPPAALARTQPRTYFYLSPAGGLGWALPAALGAQLAAPAATCVALIGDGAYLFANPAACHHVSARYELPVLTVVYNNARWGAVDAATRLVYPHGEWRAQRGPSLSDLAPIPALERYVEASGGYGERVTTRDELDAALARAVHVVREERRQAVLNVLGQ